MDKELRDKLDGGIVKVEYCSVYNGNPGHCAGCALALALENFLYDQRIAGSVEHKSSGFVI